jgi:hypothetical protein
MARTYPEDDLVREAQALLHDLRLGGERLRKAAGEHVSSANKVAAGDAGDTEQETGGA